MPIPKSRAELVALMDTRWQALQSTLTDVDATAASRLCSDNWTIADLLAVRARWAEMTVAWILAGQRGEAVSLPASGYTWSETPRLNRDIVGAAKGQTWSTRKARLTRSFGRIRRIVDDLTDRQLCVVGVYDWAGKWPVSRWILINTQTQYASARALIRKALRGPAAR